MFKIISVFSAVTFLVLLGFLFILFSQTTKAQENLFVSPIADGNKKVSVKLKPVLKDQINILLLGLDGRRGDKNPRCDAIHLISYDAAKNLITITSVPRGTEVKLSKKAESSTYISNYCHYAGIQSAAKQIEKITGIQPDYIVRVGFSQTLGILRTLNLPTTSTLQYLRNRNTNLGDYQRNHNQAVFMKDMLINYADKIADLPDSIKYLIYKMIDTDLSYETVVLLLDQMKNSQISQNPDFIKLVTTPASDLRLREVHLSLETNKSVNDADFTSYQKGLSAYLKNLLGRVDNLIKNNKHPAAYGLLKTPFAQQIWLQIEDEKVRNEYHFAFLKDFVQTSPENETLSAYILDFINEMELNQEDNLKNKAENLLKGII